MGHFLGDGVVKQVTARRESCQSTLFTEGDIMIAVAWFDRVPEDDQNLTFVKWMDPSDNPPPYGVVNSTELRAIDVALIRKAATVLPVLALPPPIRRSGRLASVVAPASDRDELSDDAQFELLPDRDARVRAECW